MCTCSSHYFLSFNFEFLEKICFTDAVTLSLNVSPFLILSYLLQPLYFSSFTGLECKEDYFNGFDITTVKASGLKNPA